MLMRFFKKGPQAAGERESVAGQEAGSAGEEEGIYQEGGGIEGEGGGVSAEARGDGEEEGGVPARARIAKGAAAEGDGPAGAEIAGAK